MSSHDSRVDDAGRVTALRVAEGTELAAFDRTGTLTSKYQARRRGGQGSKLVSGTDTPGFVSELAPVEDLDADTLGSLLPVSPPVHGKVLGVRALYERLLSLVGRSRPGDAG